ncbi:Zn-ribbon domain-containing OB-fold protein [Acidiferrimicrobium sp. IK]|uniref:Zn-ribbon domain-containing OB-fold protein n=1 Tax=Acidiferrimicrobium sp. IK TaxID=2871700 RepID=UPI0021CB549E|nr:Zn-ribbon domain-containing OB-fold protein [Acidiferrimicrobium sp. IK]MCU4184175.1 Zn-ribbon domain-containing OB-fold protein [Acidiferrimicrobium sp. IK]
MSGAGASAVTKEDLVMNHLVRLSYREELSPNLDRFVDGLLEGKLVGQRCPSCARMYVPSKGYCPLCVVAMDESEAVEVAQVGTVTAFTVITPVPYYGQQQVDPFVYASVLLDGVDTPITGQDITGIPHEQVRSGLRVRAVWKPVEERDVSHISNRGWGGLDSVISSFEATGEPDASEDSYEEYAL